MGHSLCSFILRQIPRRSPTHNAVHFTTTRLGGYSKQLNASDIHENGNATLWHCRFLIAFFQFTVY